MYYFFLYFPIYFAGYFIIYWYSEALNLMTDPLSSTTPVPSNSLVDLNINMNLSPETTLHDDIYNVKHRQPDTLLSQYYLNLLDRFELVLLCFKEIVLLT